jgi:hypothetical protein
MVRVHASRGQNPGRQLAPTLLRVPDVAKVELFGVQDEKVFVEVSQKRWRKWAWTCLLCWLS